MIGSVVETKQLEDKITKPLMYAQKCFVIFDIIKTPKDIGHYPSQ